jgi:hypothetical protein
MFRSIFSHLKLKAYVVFREKKVGLRMHVLLEREETEPVGDLVQTGELPHLFETVAHDLNGQSVYL